jgi:hypothetical protein
MVFHLFAKNITIKSCPVHHSALKYVSQYDPDASFLINIITMEGLAKDDDFPKSVQ